MVSLEKYKCLCEESEGLAILKAKTSGEQYLKCKKGGCGFFTKATDFTSYYDTIENKLFDQYKVNNPICIDGKPATLAVSKSVNNPGRPYFRCGQQQKCSFFLWGDRFTIPKKREYVDKATMTDQQQVERPRPTAATPPTATTPSAAAATAKNHGEEPKRKKCNPKRKRVIQAVDDDDDE